MFKFDELLKREEKYSLWKYKIGEIPVWYYIREEYSYSTRVVRQKFRFPSVRNIVKCIFFLITNRRNVYENIYCLMDRKDVLDFYFHETKERDSNSLLIVKNESNTPIAEFCLFSDFFDVLRFLCRKWCWIALYSLYGSMISRFRYDFITKASISRGIKLAIGDFVYGQLLRKIMPNANFFYYCGAVMPVSEKFTNLFNSAEIQHGVIHRSHPGYIGVPGVKNELILYGAMYESLLIDNGFSGKTRVINFKTSHEKRTLRKKYPIVIYTQPILELSQALNELAEHIEEPIYIKPHPRDEYVYDKKFIMIDSHHPSEVVIPILYTSSIIEDFLINEQSVFIFDANISGVSLDDYLDVYSITNPKLIRIFRSLSDLANAVNQYFSQEGEGQRLK